jgi:hypothetical protein
MKCQSIQLPIHKAKRYKKGFRVLTIGSNRKGSLGYTATKFHRNSHRLYQLRQGRTHIRLCSDIQHHLLRSTIPPSKLQFQLVSNRTMPPTTGMVKARGQILRQIVLKGNLITSGVIPPDRSNSHQRYHRSQNIPFAISILCLPVGSAVVVAPIGSVLNLRVFFPDKEERGSRKEISGGGIWGEGDKDGSVEGRAGGEGGGFGVEGYVFGGRISHGLSKV